MQQGNPGENGTGGGAKVTPYRDPLENALAGDYRLSPGEVIAEAWQRISGNKGTLWAAIAMYLAALFVLSLVLGLVFGTPPPPAEGMPQTNSPGQMLEQLLISLVATPLWVGIFFLGVAIASDRPARPASIFAWFDKVPKLFATYLLMCLMIMLGLMLFVVPGIYLAVAYQMALPLAADKDLGPWQALETSRRALTHRWFAFFSLWLVAVLATMASLLALCIPLVWVLPAVMVGLGIVYRNIFAAEETTFQRVAG